MSVDSLAKKERLGILQQSKVTNHWAAPNADNAAYKTVHWIDSGNLIVDPATTIDEFNVTSQNGVHPDVERVFIDNTSGLVRLPFSATVDKTTFAAFLAMVMQGQIVESATTPYGKVFYSHGLTAPLDWATNEGWLYTIALDQEASADDGIIIENALLDNLNLSIDFNATGEARLMKMSGTFVGNNPSTVYEHTLSGTWTNLTPVQTKFINNTDDWATNNYLIIDSVLYSSESLRRWELQINNNIFSDCKTTGGKAAQYKSKPEYRTMIRLGHNPTTEKIHKDYSTKAVCHHLFANGAVAATDGFFQLDTTSGGGGYLQKAPKIYEGDYIGIDLDIKWYGSAGASPFLISLTDTIDWGF